jgi:hypothetical protein
VLCNEVSSIDAQLYRKVRHPQKLTPGIKKAGKAGICAKDSYRFRACVIRSLTVP